MISIIIRALNEAKYFEECLKAIQNQKISEDYEIILVDSGSTDDTIKIGKSYGVAIVNIKKQDFTFGRSLNAGCEASNGDIFVFLSAHCIPTSDEWLSNLVSPLREGICGYSYGRQIARLGVSKFSESQVFEKYYPKKSSIPQTGYFCNNANAAILSKVWQKYKFDSNLTGLEDMALAKLLCNEKGSVGYVAESIVEHIHEETWRQIKIRYEREALALASIDPNLNLTFVDAFYFLLVSIVSDIKKHANFSLYTIVEILLYRSCQYWGSFRGSRISKKKLNMLKIEYFYPKTKNF